MTDLNVVAERQSKVSALAKRLEDLAYRWDGTVSLFQRVRHVEKLRKECFEVAGVARQLQWTTKEPEYLPRTIKSFHGGCNGCLQQLEHGVDICRRCHYGSNDNMDSRLGRPSLNNSAHNIADLVRAALSVSDTVIPCEERVATRKKVLAVIEHMLMEAR